MRLPLYKLLLVWSAFGCGDWSGTSESRGVLAEPVDLGPEVARVGETAIYAAQVSARARAEGIPVQEAVMALVSLHLRAAKAATLGIQAPDPPREILVQRLLEREFEVNTTPAKIPERDLRAVYERNVDQFVHPRLVRVAMLSVWTGPRMKPEPRARNRETAVALWAHLEGRPDRATLALDALAADPRWASRKVSHKEVWQAIEKPHGPVIGKAVQALRAKGELTGLLEDETGYHIARYLDERPAENRGFRDVEVDLRDLLHPTWRPQKFLELTRELARRHGAEVFAGRLDQSRQR